jgi:rhodanese-related sulfurtransferase
MLERRNESEDLVEKPLPEPTRVTVEEVMTRLGRGEPVVFLDTRSEQTWENSDMKIKGAIRVPPNDVDRFLERIPRTHSLVTYDTSVGEVFSSRAAQKIAWDGWNKDVHPLYGGFEAWRKANGPTEPK